MLGKENNWPSMSVRSFYCLEAYRTFCIPLIRETKDHFASILLSPGFFQVLVIAFFSVNRISARSETTILGYLFFYMGSKVLDILKNDYIKKPPSYHTVLEVVYIYKQTLWLSH